MKYIILGDPFTAGHHLSYLATYAKATAGQGCSVCIFSPKANDIWLSLPDSFKKYVIPFTIRPYTAVTKFPSYESNHLASTLYLWMRTAFTVWRIIFRMKEFPRLVFFLWLDHYLDENLRAGVVDIVFPFVWSGLYFHPRHVRESMLHAVVPAYMPDKVLSSRHCKSIAVLDETIRSGLAGEIAKPVIVLPDIVSSKRTDKRFSIYRDIQKKAQGRKIIACLGSLEKRKSILFLIELAEYMRKEEYFFIFVGDFPKEWFTPEELQLIERFIINTPSNCYIRTGWITSDAQFNALVDLSDLLFLGYENFYHSSNLLALAGIFSKPVIVYEKNYCMAQRTRKYHLGKVIMMHSKHQSRIAIHTLTSTAYNRSLADIKAHRQFRSLFSYGNFHKILSDFMTMYV